MNVVAVLNGLVERQEGAECWKRDLRNAFSALLVEFRKIGTYHYHLDTFPLEEVETMCCPGDIGGTLALDTFVVMLALSLATPQLANRWSVLLTSPPQPNNPFACNARVQSSRMRDSSDPLENNTCVMQRSLADQANGGAIRMWRTC